MAVGDLSFAFDPSRGETPQTVARKRMLAEAILGGTSHAPKDVGEGLNSLGQAIMYRRLMSGVTGAETAGNSGAAKIFGSLFGDQFPAAPVAGASPTASGSTAPSSPSLASAAPSGDTAQQQTASTDGAGSSDVEGYIRQRAAAYGIDPDVAVKVASGEGGLKDPFRRGQGPAPKSQAPGLGATENSYGPLQLYVSGTGAGLGDRALAAGIDPSKDWRGGVDFALKEASRKGWGQWYGAKAQGITGMMGIGQAPATAPQETASMAPLMLPGQAPIPQPNPAVQPEPVQVASNDPAAGMDRAMEGNATNHLIAPNRAIPPAIAAQLAAASKQMPPSMPLPTNIDPQSLAMPLPYAPQQPATDAKQAILQALSGQGTPQSGAAPLPDQQFDARFAGTPPAGGPQMPVDPRQAIAQAMIGQNAAPAPQDMQTASMAPVAPPQPAPPQEVAQVQPGQAAPPLPPPTTVQDRPVASAPEPDLSQLPAMAGGNADVVAPGGNSPTVQQLMQAAGDPWVMQKYGPVVEALIQQKMKQGDPGYALDLAKKKMDLQLEQQQLGGAFRGDSIDAQAWNILQTRDPSSKEYQTAYSIVSQPKMQMVQTANGMVQVQVPPVLPGWLKVPGAIGGPSTAPEGAAPNAAQAAPGLTPPAGSPAAPGAPPPGGTATASAPIPGTKQPATETQARNGAIGKILLGEVPTLGANFKALADPKGQLLNALPGGIGNAWQDPAYQRAANAVKASVSNVLYSLSGASSNPGEVLNQISILTPAFGDAPETINDKLQRFKTYVRAISSEANDPELTKSVETAISQMDMPAAPDQSQQAAPGGTPKAGTVDGGYRFKGGDPADKNNWEPVQ